MARDIAIWDSDQVFHFLSSEHVSTRVRQLLLDAGLDGDMLLTFDKQDYVELEIGLKVAEIRKLIKVKNKLVEEVVSKTMEEIYQSDSESDTESRERCDDQEALSRQEEMNREPALSSDSGSKKNRRKREGSDQKVNTMASLIQEDCGVEIDPAVVACKRSELKPLEKSELKQLPPDFHFSRGNFPSIFFNTWGSKNKNKHKARISWSLEWLKYRNDQANDFVPDVSGGNEEWSGWRGGGEADRLSGGEPGRT